MGASGGRVPEGSAEALGALEGLNTFVDEGDAGDEYNYSPPKERDETVESSSFEAVVEREVGPVFSRLRVRIRMSLPEGLEGQSRSERRVEVPVTTEVLLYRGVDRIDVRTRVENRAKDHRFRVRFPTGVKTDRVWVETHFYVVERRVEPGGGSDWVESLPTTHPQLGWVSVSDGRRGLTVATGGCPSTRPGERTAR